MFDNNNVAISVVDDETDDHGRIRARAARRKRKKLRGDNVLAVRLLRKLLKYWMLLIILPALGFLLFGASIIGIKPSSITSSQLGTPDEFSLFNYDSANVNQSRSRPALRKDANTNLNRLDPTTRVIGGVRQRCLPLLPPEELDQLDIPVEKDFRGPVKKVSYISESDTSRVGVSTDLTQQHPEITRFNLFTGNQTLQERDSSFEVKETMRLHCGFYSSAGGFKITDKDKSYMDACKVVVSTCAFGGGDDLYQPIGMSEASLGKVCYVAFWDEITVRAQELAGHRIAENGFIGKWRVVVVSDLPFSDQRLNGKIPKMLSHRLFPQAEYSIFVDSKSQFRRDPLGVLEVLLWRSKSVLAISEHGARGSVYDEAKAVVRKNKATPEEVEVQINQYRKAGLPQDKRFDGKKALSEASVIVRKHTPLTNLLMCVWFNEVVRFTSRDQLSFPYVLWRLRAYGFVNMFPVCTRKDLVNSMGHLHKVKPLQS